MWEGKPVTPHFAWGIYLDDDTGGVDVIGNIVLRCGRGGLHAHNARDCVVTNNLFADNRDWQFDYHGWTTQGRFWEQHLTTLTKGYEEVAGRSEWVEIRGINVHPRDFPSPGGLLIAGNRFEKNILVSSNAQTPILDVLRVPFDQNVFDYNLYWAPNGEVRTNMRSFGADTGKNLVSAFVGKVGETPQGWRWSKRTPESSAILNEVKNQTLVMALSAEGGSPSGKDQPIIFGEDIELESGAAYRLRAKLRASIAGSAQVGVHCFVPKRPFWTSPVMQREVSTEWADYEWVFSVPKQGEKGWHDEMKRFNVRVGWKAGSGILEVGDVQLHKVEESSQWEAWLKNGVDGHSLVADPLFEKMESAQLRKDSPAWKLGFEKIPFEQIGPRAGKLKR
jgi:parallel beta-helix repeat protein